MNGKKCWSDLLKIGKKSFLENEFENYFTKFILFFCCLDDINQCFASVANGFFNTSITLSPRRNIFDIKRSLLTGLAFFLPLPLFGTSVHISFTFSSTILQWRSNAFTRPSSLRLLRQLINTWVLFFTDCVNTDNGPVLNSSSSNFWSSSCDISLFGFCGAAIFVRLMLWWTNDNDVKLKKWSKFFETNKLFSKNNRQTNKQTTNDNEKWKQRVCPFNTDGTQLNSRRRGLSGFSIRIQWIFDCHLLYEIGNS